jgi:hypothetical protein
MTATPTWTHSRQCREVDSGVLSERRTADYGRILHREEDPGSERVGLQRSRSWRSFGSPSEAMAPCQVGKRHGMT